MKKTFFSLLITLSLVAFPSTLVAAENAPIHSTTPPPTEMPAEVRVMLDRLEEIKDLDKSSLSSAEKKELRKEVRAIKKDVRASGNGLYISSGVIILILLLIILL
jgi:hypothetical protein